MKIEPKDNLPIGTEMTDQRPMNMSIATSDTKAMIEARYLVAYRNPRNWDQVRLDILGECKRPAFANNPSAYYIKPIGKGVRGLGIRFTEVALRCMKNVLIESNMIYEDDKKEIHRVSVTDLEANITYPLDVKVEKTVERNRPDDGNFISVRKNSLGKPVYTVVASEDDLLNKRGAMISKAIRTLGNRIIPGDIQDEAIETILKVRQDTTAKDPQSEKKRIIDAFAGIGVNAEMLADYLDHPIEQSSPQELMDLRGIYGAIKDGEASWRQVMNNKADEAPDAGQARTTPDKKANVSTTDPVNQKDEEPKKDGLPEYPSDRFAFNSKKWMEDVTSGSKTTEQIITAISAKFTMSESQINTIKSWSNK